MYAVHCQAERDLHGEDARNVSLKFSRIRGAFHKCPTHDLCEIPGIKYGHLTLGWRPYLHCSANLTRHHTLFYLFDTISQLGFRLSQGVQGWMTNSDSIFHWYVPSRFMYCNEKKALVMH